MYLERWDSRRACTWTWSQCDYLFRSIIDIGESIRYRGRLLVDRLHRNMSHLERPLSEVQTGSPHAGRESSVCGTVMLDRHGVLLAWQRSAPAIPRLEQAKADGGRLALGAPPRRRGLPLTVQQSHLQRVWTVERLRAILRPFPQPTLWTFSALSLPRPPARASRRSELRSGQLYTLG